jgi:hypothetical protein
MRFENVGSNFLHLRAAMLTPFEQIFWLLTLAAPVSAVSWAVTHEELFHELQEFSKRESRQAPVTVRRKAFYLLTCEFCFSHYVAIVFLWLTHFQLLVPGWRGYLVALFALVWTANLYMSLYAHIRLDVKQERIEIKRKETALKEKRTA